VNRRILIPRDVFGDIVFAITFAVCTVLAIEFMMQAWDLLRASG
jgi:hypothetical protein